MTTPEAGRVEELARMLWKVWALHIPGRPMAFDGLPPELRQLVDDVVTAALTTQAETIREQAQAIRDHKFTLQTQGETIRRLEGAMPGVAAALEDRDKWKQRAEAAEQEVTRVAKLVRCGWPPCAQATDVSGPFICINHRAVYGPTT